MSAAILNRTGTIPPVTDISGNWRRSPAGGHDAGVSLCRRSQTLGKPLDVQVRWNLASPSGTSNPLRRVRSDADVIESAPLSSSGARRLPPALLLEVEENDLDARGWKEVSADVVLADEIEEVEYSGGSGKGTKSMRVSLGDGGNEENKGNRMIDNYYQEMLRLDPGNPLFLRNYGRFLHEVKRDLKKAEDYYERSILASPGDGEVLSLYARLIWESQRDFKRAESLHELAVEASPEDCYVLGSYAHFLWEAEEKGKEEGTGSSSKPSEDNMNSFDLFLFRLEGNTVSKSS